MTGGGQSAWGVIPSNYNNTPTKLGKKSGWASFLGKVKVV